MKVFKFTIILIVLLSITALLNSKQTLGASFKGDPQDAAQGDLEDAAIIMGAFFGNHIPALDVSYLEPGMTQDPQLLDWTIASRSEIIELEGFGELSSKQKSALASYAGKIPIKYLKHWSFGEYKILLLFEAGSWDFDLESWGGTGFESSHNMGGAVYEFSKGAWKCTGYDLNLGKFGTYRSTSLDPDPLFLDNNTYAIQTLDYGSAFISIIEGKPKVILRICFWSDIGHGSEESYRSTLSLSRGKNYLFDITVESIGDAYYNTDDEETGPWPLHQSRTYQYDAQLQEYRLIRSEGNIQEINKFGEVWFMFTDS